MWALRALLSHHHQSIHLNIKHASLSNKRLLLANNLPAAPLQSAWHQNLSEIPPTMSLQPHACSSNSPPLGLLSQVTVILTS